MYFVMDDDREVRHLDGKARWREMGGKGWREGRVESGVGTSLARLTGESHKASTCPGVVDEFITFHPHLQLSKPGRNS